MYVFVYRWEKRSIFIDCKILRANHCVAVAFRVLLHIACESRIHVEWIHRLELCVLDAGCNNLGSLERENEIEYLMSEYAAWLFIRFCFELY